MTRRIPDHEYYFESFGSIQKPHICERPFRKGVNVCFSSLNSSTVGRCLNMNFDLEMNFSCEILFLKLSNLLIFIARKSRNLQTFYFVPLLNLWKSFFGYYFFVAAKYWKRIFQSLRKLFLELSKENFQLWNKEDNFEIFDHGRY